MEVSEPGTESEPQLWPTLQLWPCWILWPTVLGQGLNTYLHSNPSHCNQILVFFFFFCLFRSAPSAHRGSLARGLIGATAAGHSHSHSNTESASATHGIAQGNARSLTQWAGPGIKPASSWILVGFVNHWATTGNPVVRFLIHHAMARSLNLLWYTKYYSC